MYKECVIKSFLVILMMSILAACGGSGDSVSISVPDENGESVALSGQVADGYLVGARVFLDRNNNLRLDADEPWTLSEGKGRYLLDVTAWEAEIYPVVAEIIAGETYDEDQAGYVTESYQLAAPAGKGSFISPLTTLVKAKLDKNPSLKIADAEADIRENIGLPANISLFKDYVADERLEYAHRAGRIIAGMMGRLQADIEDNLGTADLDNQKNAIALVISDLVMCNCNEIAMALDTAENTEAIEQIKVAILAKIDTMSLDEDLLNHYNEKLQEENPVWDMAASEGQDMAAPEDQDMTTPETWDMTAPEILSQVPPAASGAAIDTVVKFVFNEALDPETIQDSSVIVTGPYGQVAGFVNYDAVLKELSFTPIDYLMAFSDYQVSVADVTDLYGNPVKGVQTSSFTTIFNQHPPELPDF